MHYRSPYHKILQSMNGTVEEVPPIVLTDFKEKKKSIGNGAFSYVKLVTKDGKDYAEKILFSIDLTNERDVLHFKREISILNKYRHPTIIKFISYGYIDEKPAIITEYAENGSLRDFISLDESEQKLNDTQKNIIIFGIALGMSYLHKHNVIHRDLNQSNILLDENFFPLIGGFVLAKQTDYNYLIKSNDEAKGTSYYIAPESYNEEEYSNKSDVYAFAMIMYEILVVNISIVLKRNKLKYFALPLKGFRPSFPEDMNPKFKDLIKKCWSTIPTDRPEFSLIVSLLRNDEGFLLENANKEEFFSYINLMDEKIKEIEEAVPRKKIKVPRALKPKVSSKKTDDDDEKSKSKRSSK